MKNTSSFRTRSPLRAQTDLNLPSRTTSNTFQTPSSFPARVCRTILTMQRTFLFESLGTIPLANFQSKIPTRTARLRWNQKRRIRPGATTTSIELSLWIWSSRLKQPSSERTYPARKIALILMRFQQLYSRWIDTLSILLLLLLLLHYSSIVVNTNQFRLNYLLSRLAHSFPRTIRIFSSSPSTSSLRSSSQNSLSFSSPRDLWLSSPISQTVRLARHWRIRTIPRRYSRNFARR